MATEQGRATMTSLAEKYNEIIEFEETARPALYEQIVDLMDSGHATGAEIARSLGLQRQRIYQIAKDVKERREQES